jgi:hypothetical protein
MSQELLLYTQALQQAKQEIATLGGKVIHQFTDIVIVVNLPDSIDPQTLQQSTTIPPSSLDSVSQLAVDAWNNLQAKKLAGEALSATEGLSWDTPGYSSPRYGNVDPAALNSFDNLAESLPAESSGTPTSRYMVGSVAVGIVIVSGTRTDLAFSNAEQQQVIQEAQEGLNFLASAESRANITFVYDIRLITVAARPGTTDTYENAEAPWRDEALQQMGFPANRAGSVQYVQHLRTNRRTDWAYVGYFTKYPLHHFAYAIDEKVCMNYANDGWGSNQINRVFAHESCHIFGAADEYGDCSCGGSHGHLGIPNNNCVKCSGTHVSCLMDANVLELCQWSRGQIGWDGRLFPNGMPSDPAGYVGDVPRVVYRKDNHIYEIAIYPETGNWGRFDMTAATGAPPAVGDPMGCAGDVPRVVYRGQDNHIHDISIYPESGNWGHFDLTAATNAPLAAGDPANYFGKVPRVIYRGQDNHIHDISIYPESGSWGHFDMTIDGA